MHTRGIFMNKFVLLLLTSFLTALITTPLQAQWTLGLRSDIGYGICRDNGLSPITFKGGRIEPGFSLNYTPKKLSDWHFSASGSIDLGGYEDATPPRFNFNSFAGLGTFSLEAKHDIKPDSLSRWHFLGGASISNLLWIYNNPKLNNASLTLSDFVLLDISAEAHYILGSRWELWCNGKFAPLGTVFRPGFAQIDNYTSDSEGTIHTYFSTYDWHLIGPCHLATGIGATFKLNGENNLSLGYGWSYLTSRNAGPYKLQIASHSFLLQLNVRL